MIDVRFSDSVAYPAQEEFLATWSMHAPPAAGDVVVLGGRAYEVEGRLWRGESEAICSVSRYP
jgi:hypothetical protein